MVEPARHEYAGLHKSVNCVSVSAIMVQLSLKPEIESKVRERLSAGLDANELMEVALEALEDRDFVRNAVDEGWRQADAGDFVESSPESVINRADKSR